MVVGGGDVVGNYQTDTVNVLRLQIVDGSFVEDENDALPTEQSSLPPQTSTTAALPSTQETGVLSGRHLRLGVASWGHGANAQHEVREAQGLAFGGGLYIFGGFTAPFWHAMGRKSWMYDLAADRWVKRKVMPIASVGGRGISHCGQARDDTRIFMVGGMLQNQGETWPLAHSVASVIAYLPQENQWESLPPLPAARAAGAAAVLDGVLHFIGGGMFEPTQKFVEDFDDHWALDLAGPAAGWITLGPITVARNHLGAVVHLGKLYNFGGQFLELEHSTNQQIAEVYDAAADRWDPLPLLPVGLGHITPSVVSYRTAIIIAGGRVNAGAPAQPGLWVYDTEAGHGWRFEETPFGGSSQVAGIIADNIVIQNGDRIFTGRLQMATADTQSDNENGKCTNKEGEMSDQDIASLVATGVASGVFGAFVAVVTMYCRQRAAQRRRFPAANSSVASSERQTTLGSELSRLESEDSVGTDSTDTTTDLNIKNGLKGMELELDLDVFKTSTFYNQDC